MSKPSSNGRLSNHLGHSSSEWMSKDDLLEVSKALYDELKNKTKDLITSSIYEVKSELSVQLGKVFESQLKKSLEAEFDARLKFYEKQWTEQVEFLRKSYGDFLEHIKGVLDRLEHPTINMQLPEQMLPTINVTVPESAIRVNLPDMSPIVNVQVPEQKALPAPIFQVPEAVVNVHIPEQKTPEVHVNVPQPRLIQKSITYDDYGRPVQIDEVERK